MKLMNMNAPQISMFGLSWAVFRYLGLPSFPFLEPVFVLGLFWVSAASLGLPGDACGLSWTLVLGLPWAVLGLSWAYLVPVPDMSWAVLCHPGIVRDCLVPILIILGLSWVGL